MMTLKKCDAQKLEEMEKLFDSEWKILVNVTDQRLHLVNKQKWIASYPISTAKNGVGQEEGSGKTPLGLHLIESKIGDGAAPFEIFSSRISTGKMAEPVVGGDAIVGRILWLKGVELGINQGKDRQGKVVDTYSRYIYIHGTNDVENIGKAVSAGCIRMKPSDVITLFEKVTEKTPVYIYMA